MTMRALGIYRETDFSPGKVAADAAILDAVLAELRSNGFETSTTEPALLGAWSRPGVDLVLAMCQGEEALKRLGEIERAGAIAVNSALSIRNCYRDLLGAAMARGGVPIPSGALVETSPALEAGSLAALQAWLPLYVKRGDLHALSADDVKRVEGLEGLRAALLSFRRSGIGRAYLQQAVDGVAVKFYGVSGGEYFSASPEHGELPEAIEGKLARAASAAASALGLEAWGGDAILERNGDFKIVDFNDWPSYSRVREDAARAIARRAMRLWRRSRHNSLRAGSL